MKKSSLAAAVLVPLAAAAVALAAQQPSQPPAKPASRKVEPPASSTLTFPSQVEQVVVDVVVTDKKGTAVPGLKREDLTVLEDGVPQQIVSFEAIVMPEKPPAVPPPPPRVSTNSSPDEQRGRTFAVIFDDTHMTPWRANQAKAAVASFLEKGVREGDRVSLVSTAGGIWWTARMVSGRAALLDSLKRLDGRYIPDIESDRMSEWEALRIHMYHDQLIAERVLRRWDTYGVASGRRAQEGSRLTDNTVDDALLSGRADEVYQQATTRIRSTLDMVERVTNGLATAKGRKSVLLVSEGFISDYNLVEFKRVNDAARRANATVYFVNARGLESMPAGMTAQFGPALPDQDVGGYFAEQLDAVAGAEQVADDSGGFSVKNANDLAKGIQKIVDQTRAYYLLGYIPTNATRDGRFRKIKVKLAQPKGFEVHARKGYYAPSDDPKRQPKPDKPGVDPVFQAALDSPWAQDGIGLRVTDYSGDEKMMGKAAVRIAAEVDGRSLQFQEKDGRSVAELDFLLVVAHRQSGEYFRYDQAYTMKLLPKTRERLERLWMPVVRDFDLVPGEYQAKLVVRDKRTGRVGTVMHDFEVPPLDKFRVSTPVLSDSKSPTPADEGVPGGLLAVIARREFATDSLVQCQFDVYGAQKDDKTGMPRVLQGFVVKRPDGTPFAAMAPTAIKPTSLGHLTRMFGFKLTDAAPGQYELMMTLRDELSGRSLEWHEPFTVAPPFGFAPGAEPPAAAAAEGDAKSAPPAATPVPAPPATEPVASPAGSSEAAPAGGSTDKPTVPPATRR